MQSVSEIVDRFMQPIDREPVSPALRGLLEEFYTRAVERPPKRCELKVALIRLLSFLATKEGRTNANCNQVDSFVMIDDHWAHPWSELPEEYIDVIALMGEALHDAISAPDIAENFGCMPEQILERAKSLPE